MVRRQQTGRRTKPIADGGAWVFSFAQLTPIVEASQSVHRLKKIEQRMEAVHIAAVSR